MRHRPPGKRDTRTPIKPIPLHIQLHLLPIRRILKMHTTLTTPNREMPFHLEPVPVRRLAVETLGNGEHLVLDGEELVVLHVGEFLAVAEGEDVAFAFADLEAVDGVDGEVVAGEGEDLLLHLQSLLVRTVERGIGGLRTQRWVERGEFVDHGCGGGWVEGLLVFLMLLGGWVKMFEEEKEI